MNPPDLNQRPVESKPDHITGEIVRRRIISAETFLLDLSLPVDDSFRIAPGQFFMIKTGPGYDPLLRRPFSVFSLGRMMDGMHRRISILFRAVGRGTDLMATWSCGHAVDMVGPLGRGYTVPEGLRSVALIAGGLGIASLFALAEWILQRRRRPEVWVYLGGKSKRQILAKATLERMGARVRVTTDDGSMGTQGLVSDRWESLAHRLAEHGKSAVYACGPLEMLAAVARITAELSLPCQVSLEARMACGMGSCLGCAVRTKDGGYKMVCKDGPVFDARQIHWGKTGRLV